MKSCWNFAEFKVIICLNVLQNCSAKQKLLPEKVEISKKIVLVRGNSPRPYLSNFQKTIENCKSVKEY